MQRFGRSRSSRTVAGSAITETGPALFILFIMILFPLIDLMYMGLAYGIVYYLNFLEVRELAVREPADTAVVLQDLDNLFVQQGLGKFIGLAISDIQHPLPGQATRAGDPLLVTCTTQAQVDPFLSLPFIMPVAGINSPVTFEVSSSRLQEENGLN
ncbi:MAG: hypothetical protein KC777_02865 [Cyanobacteria bacterium HKST-UBA02]|nr:hypothetical protein [Cyanobacteria bacterium HKST-UBA02]